MNRDLRDKMKFTAALAEAQLAAVAHKARQGARGPLVNFPSKGMGVRVKPPAAHRSTPPGVRAAGSAHVSEARHLIKGMFSLAQDVVVGVAEGTRNQISQGLRAGTSALAPPGIVAAGRVPRGHSVEVLMIVENSTEEEVCGLRFQSSPLVAPGRRPIPADAVTVGSEHIDVEAGGQCQLVVTVQVPARAPTGRYVGSLEADGPPPVQATVTVDVV
ncbi:MAG: hypothetical protein M3137_14805 [Actinomycetota bacterium]|nr:hypothetical protein [Actinomycetota bacterium]